jgi:hypothetical protein
VSEVVSAAVILALGLGWIAIRHIRSRPGGPELQSADFVVFRTQPILLPLLSNDMAEAGWALANTSVTGAESLYRFEKNDPEAAALPHILEAKGVMQRTANREIGADVVLAVDHFGSRKTAHA